MQIGFGEVESERFAGVAGNAYLSAYLLLGGVQSRLAQRMLHHAVEFAAYQTQTLARIARIATEIYRPQTRVRVALHHTFNCINKSVALSERNVEASIHARSAQYIVEKIERDAARIVNIVGTCAQHNVRQMSVHVVLYGLWSIRWHSRRCSVAQRERFGLNGRSGSIAGGATRVVRLLKQPYQLVEAYVAVGKEYGVVRTVQPACEIQGIFSSVSAQNVCRTQNVVTQRMPLVYSVFEQIVYQFGRRIVVTFNLVDYHLNLLVNLRLRICAVKHYVCEQIDSTVDVVAQYGSMINRLLLVGESVQVAANTFQIAQNLHRTATLSTLKRDVFAEVCHSLAARLLVACARCHGITAVNNGRSAGQLYYAQAVAECMCIVVHIQMFNICKVTLFVADFM